MPKNDLRVPPNAKDAEAIVLTAIMLDQEQRPHLFATLKPDWFYRPTHAVLYSLLRDMDSEGLPIEPESVALFAQEQGKLESIDGPQTLVDVLEYFSSTPLHYAEILRTKYLQRQCIEIAREILDTAYEQTADPKRILSTIADRVIELESGNTAAEVRLADSLEQTIREIEERETTPAGIPTGFVDVDRMLGGLRPGQLIILAARPRVGKSALALQIAENIATLDVGDVLFITLEMSHGEQTERLLIGRSQVDGRDVLKGHLTEVQTVAIANAARDLKPLPLVYLDRCFELDEILATSKALHSRSPLSLIIIDYLQLCEVAGVSENQRERAVAKISRSMKRLAQQLHVPVMALSQLNRECEKRQDKRPQLSDLRESGAIEQDANVVMFLHRPELFDTDAEVGAAELIVAKNRGGSVGMLALKFIGEHVRFADADPYQNVSDSFG
jgi:replicative DNA helicase